MDGTLRTSGFSGLWGENPQAPSRAVVGVPRECGLTPPAWCCEVGTTRAATEEHEPQGPRGLTLACSRPPRVDLAW